MKYFSCSSALIILKRFQLQVTDLQDIKDHLHVCMSVCVISPQTPRVLFILWPASFSSAVPTGKRAFPFSKFLFCSWNSSQVPMVLRFLTTLLQVRWGRVYSHRREVREKGMKHELHEVFLPGRIHLSTSIPYRQTASWAVCKFLSHTAVHANHNAGILQFGLDSSDIYYCNSSSIFNVNTSIKSELACLYTRLLIWIRVWPFFKVSSGGFPNQGILQSISSETRDSSKVFALCCEKLVEEKI